MRRAALSGLYAALGSVAGKISFGDPAKALGAWVVACIDWEAEDAVAAVARVSGGDEGSVEDFCDFRSVVVLVIRGAFLVAMLLLNGAMIRTYVRALSTAGTLVSTVTNTATNLVASSAIGWALFGEALSSQWAAGAALTLAGVFVIQHAQSSNIQATKAKEE